MSHDIHLDLHGLLLLKVVAPESRLVNLIQTRLGRLVVSNPALQPDFVVRAVDRLQGLKADDRLPLQMIPDGEDRHWCAGLQKSGKPQVLVCPGPPTELRYVPKHTSMGRLWWVLLIMLRRLLMRTGAMLCHGAVLARNGHGLVIAGHRGQGKTSLTLRLLREGWDYLAEDKFILSDGSAHAFEQQIRLRPYHAALLAERSPLRTQLEKMERRRTQLLPLLQPALRLIPGEFADRVRNRLDRSISVRMEQLDGSGLFMEQIPVRDVVLLRYDPDPPRETNAAHGASAFSQLQGLAFSELHALDDLFDYYANSDSQDLANLALANLRAARFRCLNPRCAEDWQFLEEVR